MTKTKYLSLHMKSITIEFGGSSVRVLFTEIGNLSIEKWDWGLQCENFHYWCISKRRPPAMTCHMGGDMGKLLIGSPYSLLCLDTFQMWGCQMEKFLSAGGPGRFSLDSWENCHNPIFLPASLSTFGCLSWEMLHFLDSCVVVLILVH